MKFSRPKLNSLEKVLLKANPKVAEHLLFFNRLYQKGLIQFKDTQFFVFNF